ncbi:MAG: neutral/alkaline non-lysosomal ceramidase N-terminal domain-containing protein [Deltaproteobacteria bacterium]|nr:neutral/alkaline non-lysosomal ceramidase N-terminal domain-containing protein [Deltaproteobacteria bacterium]
MRKLLAVCAIIACLAWSGCGEPGPWQIEAGASTVVFSDRTPNDDFLELNALVLRAGEDCIAFCTVDAMGVGSRLIDEVDERLSQVGSAIGRDNLMIAASHTHSGGFHGIQEGLVHEMVLGTFSQEKLDQAADLVAQVVMDAEQALQPARFYLGEGSAPEFNSNRAFFDGFADPAMVVLYIESLDSEPLAWLINYAAHPTILYADNAPRPGRDFPGGLASTLRDESGLELPVLFVNAAAGNVQPEPPDAPSYTQQAFQMGQGLAEIAIGIIDGQEAQSMARLRHETRVRPLPMAISGSLIPTQTAVWEFGLGDSVFLSMPGEACSQVGRALREFARKNGAGTVLLCGYVNDYLGYHPDESEYFLASYESMMCMYGPLMTCWYIESHFGDDRLPWDCSGILAANRKVFERAIGEGQADRQIIEAAWAEEFAKLTDESEVIGMHIRAFAARMDMKGLSDEERALLMGIAEGADIAFDIVMLLQYQGNLDYL